jgi:dihydroflavonol-4-reductase
VQGTKNVVNTCLQNGVKKLVHISSVAALGREKSQSIIDENSKWTESKLNSAYAESKYLAELEVFRAGEEGLNTVILNPSLIMAPANWNKSSAQVFKYVWKKNPFYFDGTTNIVDVRDVAEVACKLLHANLPGERFILNAASISFHDLFQKIADHFKRKPPFIKVNKNVLKILAVADEFRAYILRTPPLITRENARLADTNYFYNNQKVKQVLNFEFNPIDATLQWCCEYYLRQVNGKK